jgi:hypothetical protein
MLIYQSCGSTKTYFESPPSGQKNLTPCPLVGPFVVNSICHFGQCPHCCFKGRPIDGVEEVTSNAREVDGPRRLQFRHTLPRELRQVATSVYRTHCFRHKTVRLETVHEARHAACGHSGGSGQIGHPQLAIGRLGQMHDRRVFARRKTRTLSQVAVKNSWHDFDDSHHRTPQLLFVGRQWFDSCHAIKNNLLGQANMRNLGD